MPAAHTLSAQSLQRPRIERHPAGVLAAEGARFFDVQDVVAVGASRAVDDALGVGRRGVGRAAVVVFVVALMVMVVVVVVVF